MRIFFYIFAISIIFGVWTQSQFCSNENRNAAMHYTEKFRSQYTIILLIVNNCPIFKLLFDQTRPIMLNINFDGRSNDHQTNVDRNKMYNTPTYFYTCCTRLSHENRHSPSKNVAVVLNEIVLLLIIIGTYQRIFDLNMRGKTSPNHSQDCCDQH